MEGYNIARICVLVLTCINISSCDICYRTARRYEQQKICCRYDWNNCELWEYRTVTRYIQQSYCCPGWTGSGCRTPICSPDCKQGGTCVRPNTCLCPIGSTGSRCEVDTCSHRKPCFPGSCNTNNVCTCISGFSGANCSTMTNTQQPHITHASTTMTYIPKAGALKGQVIYWYMSDASEPNQTKPDHRWIHFQKFNKLDFLVEALYNPPNITILPRYVTKYLFGIVGGEVEAILTKVVSDTQTKASFGMKYNLSSMGIDKDHPEPNVAIFNKTEDDFNTRIDHGDNLTITATIQSGGYEVLKDLNNGHTSNLYYSTQETYKTMIFHFDFEAPYHCSINGCHALPLSIGPDITKASLQIVWSGWKDELDEISRYNLEIHELKAGSDGKLTEVSPMRPMYSEVVDPFNVSASGILYSLPKAGMYSVVLDAADRANNSDWARQFVLYDPTSNITTDPQFKFYVAEARPETNYHWISSISGRLKVTWKGHFRNKFHEDNKLLNEIKPFYTTAMDGMYIKKVKEIYDDHNGTRTKEPISNIHGIISFEIFFDKDHSGGNNSERNPSSIQSWTHVSNFTTESTTIEPRLSNGDTLSIWVRAKDIMGNELVDRMLVHVDSTAPTITSVKLQKFVGTKFQYGSRVVVSTEDEESGIHQIKWTIEDINSSKKYQTGDISGNFSSPTSIQLVNVQYDNCVLTELLQFDGIESCYNSEKQDNSAIIGAAVGGGIGGLLIILLIVVIIILFLMKTGRLSKKQKGARYQTNLPSKHQLDNKKAYNNSAYCAESEMDDIYLYGGMKFDTTPAWIIPHSKITLEDKIGSGRFADIFKARYDTKQNDKTSVVAKMLQMNFKEEDKLVMMAKINFFATHVGEHRNVLGFIGAVTDNDHFGPYMILEYCEEGNLRDWLLRKKDKVSDDTIEKLFQMVFGVAQGMKYLASKKIIHRRLAARNILLPFTLMPKVAGFGPSPSDETKDKNDTTKERVPVKWMAPECTESTADATTKSDVWSYGIVMWEILSLGETPYGGISSRDVPSKIQNGHRLGRPEYAEDIHYNLMKKCWNLKQDGRPDFNVIVKELDNTFRTSPSDNYYYQS